MPITAGKPEDNEHFVLMLDAHRYETDRTIKVDGVYLAKEVTALCDSGAPDDEAHNIPMKLLWWTDDTGIEHFGCRDCLADPRGYVRVVSNYPGDHWDIDYPDKDVSNA